MSATQARVRSRSTRTCQLRSGACHSRRRSSVCRERSAGQIVSAVRSRMQYLDRQAEVAQRGQLLENMQLPAAILVAAEVQVSEGRLKYAMVLSELPSRCSLHTVQGARARLSASSSGAAQFIPISGLCKSRRTPDLHSPALPKLRSSE